jgi:hypothetical protein
MKIDYSKLYFDEEIQVSHEHINNNYPIECSIGLRGLCNNIPDCTIGHFGYNFFFRTSKGLTGQAYKSKETLKRSVEKLLIKNGFKVIKWQLKGA